MDPLLDNPAVTSAWRFMIAALAQAVALLTLHYAATTEGRYRGHRLALFGWALESQSWALHQGYYWMWWLLQAKRPDLLDWWSSWRHVSTVAITIGALAWILVAAPYLKSCCGSWWFAGGVVFVLALWTIGYGFATWL